jgi:hypothetical protein
MLQRNLVILVILIKCTFQDWFPHRHDLNLFFVALENSFCGISGARHSWMLLDRLSNLLPFFHVFLNSPECELPTELSVDEGMALAPSKKTLR